jgi:cytochrome c556
MQMKQMKMGLWTALGVAALAVVVTVVARVEAADKAALQKIVDSLKSGKTADAAAAAKAYAKAHDDVDELMTAFKKGDKGGMLAVGIEATLIKFGRDVPSPAALSKGDYADMGTIISAVGLVNGAIPAPKGAKGSAADWAKWSKELVDNGEKLQAALKSKTPADVKAMSSKINAACNSCHTAFR